MPFQLPGDSPRRGAPRALLLLTSAAAVGFALLHAIGLAGFLEVALRDAMEQQNARMVERWLGEELREHGGADMLGGLRESGRREETGASLFRIMGDVGALHLQVYDDAGTQLWSDRGPDFEPGPPDPELFASALAGVPGAHKKLLPSWMPDAKPGSTIPVTEAVVPLRSPAGLVAGVAVLTHPTDLAAAGAHDVRHLAYQSAAIAAVMLAGALLLIFMLGRRRVRELEEDVRAKGVALRQEKRNLETIVGGLGAGLALVDTDHRVVWANRVLVDWTGVRPGSETWHPCRVTGPDCAGPCDDCPTAAAITTGQEARAERVIALPDGGERRLVIAAWPIRDEDGQITQALELV